MSNRLGDWYRVAAERGQSDLIPFYYIDKNKKVKSLSFRHRENDGAGFLTGLLGVRPAKSRIPHPDPSKKILWTIRGIFKPYQPPKLEWKKFSPEIKFKFKTMFWLQLSPEAVADLKKYCVNQGYGLNSFLMDTIGKIMLQNSLTETGSWLYPVNMRGWLDRETDPGVWASYVPVEVSKNSSVTGIHQQLKARLSRGEHWSNWYLGNIVPLLGKPIMRILSRRASEKQFWLGSFSDLGEWSVENSDYGPEGFFTVCPPGSPNYPISVASMTWFGTKTISLKLHPSLGEAEDRPGQVLLELQKIIEAKLGRAHPMSHGSYSDPEFDAV